MAGEAWDELLAALATANNDSKFRDFQTIPTTYKQLDDKTQINAHILLPRKISEDIRTTTAPLPLIVRIHGGYLVGGSSLYPPWFTDWILELALKHGAAIITPNYRLMPESNGTDILEDMDDLWAWIKSGAPNELLRASNLGPLSIDMRRILLMGESAGGYLAMQLALSHPKDVRGLICCYPMLDIEDPFYHTAFNKPIIGVPNCDPKILDDHLAAMASEGNRSRPTAAEPPDRLGLSFVIVQQGRYLEFLGSQNSRLFPFRRLKDQNDADGEGMGSSLPPMFIFHGQQDSAVPCAGTVAFEKQVRSLRPKARLKVSLQAGDHGFDAEAHLQTPWLKEGLEDAVRAWVGTKT